eukprot:Skav227483  [mRNA]  locus=scaffold2491:573973:574980:+ [translate_table: standard]
MPETLTKVGIIGNHNTWVTALSIADPFFEDKPEDPHLLLSASRDGLLKLWSVPDDAAKLKVVCKGHRDVVSSCRLSGNGQFAISCSWDRSMKIWSLASESAELIASGRAGAQQNSVILSQDNRQIFTGGSEIHVWNALGENKFTLGSWCDDRHTDWISALEWVPSTSSKEAHEDRTCEFLSASWDHKLKHWDAKTMKLVKDFIGHQGVVHCIAISPDGSLIASGGQEARVILWDFKEGVKIYELLALSTVNSVAFSPMRYWLAVATDVSVEVYDLEIKQQIWAESGPALPENIPWATCLTWSGNGDRLFVGHSDGAITHFRVVDKRSTYVNLRSS